MTKRLHLKRDKDELNFYKVSDNAGKGAQGYIRLASGFRRSVTIDNVKLNRGSLIDYINTTISDPNKKLTKGFLGFIGGASEKKIQETFNNIIINKLPPTLVKIPTVNDSLIDGPWVANYIECVKGNGLILKDINVSKMSQANYQTLVLVAVGQNGMAFEFVNSKIPTLNDYAKIALEAVKQNGLALQYVNREGIEPDIFKKLVTAAIAQNPLALEYAGEFRADEDIVYAAAKKGLAALQFAPPSLLRKKEFFHKMLDDNDFRIDYGFLTFASTDIRSNKEIIRKAVHKDMNSLNYANESLKEDKAFILELLNDPDILYTTDVFTCAKVLQNDRDIVEAAISRTPSIYRMLSETFKKDPSILKAGLTANPNEFLGEIRYQRKLEVLYPLYRADKDFFNKLGIDLSEKPINWTVKEGNR